MTVATNFKQQHVIKNGSVSKLLCHYRSTHLIKQSYYNKKLNPEDYRSEIQMYHMQKCIYMKENEMFISS